MEPVRGTWNGSERRPRRAAHSGRKPTSCDAQTHRARVTSWAAGAHSAPRARGSAARAPEDELADARTDGHQPNPEPVYPAAPQDHVRRPLDAEDGVGLTASVPIIVTRPPLRSPRPRQEHHSLGPATGTPTDWPRPRRRESDCSAGAEPVAADEAITTSTVIQASATNTCTPVDRRRVHVEHVERLRTDFERARRSRAPGGAFLTPQAASRPPSSQKPSRAGALDELSPRQELMTTVAHPVFLIRCPAESRDYRCSSRESPMRFRP